MRKFTLDTEVTFYASLGFVTANRSKTKTVAEWGVTDEYYENMTDEEIEDFLYDMQEQWLSEVLDSGIEYEGQYD